MEKAVDLFLAYNERDKERIASIADWLEAYGISVHFFDRDLPLGAPVDDTPVMEAAPAVAVFLGETGWGPNHLRIAERALALNKPVYPVLIGEADEKDLAQAGGLFAAHRWLDLRGGDLDQLEKLVARLQVPPDEPDPALDAVADDLSTGTESQRRTLLQRIIEGQFKDPRALADALVRELSRRGVEADGRSPAKVSSGDTHASGRSWLRSALVWCLPEDSRTRDIALHGLSTDTEPVAYARFWTLAALCGAKASYLAEAALSAKTDPSWDVVYLALAALDPASPELHISMRAAFGDLDGARIHGILRALRVVPIPALVPEVAGLLASGLLAQSVPYEVTRNFEVATYDVFCALATQPMLVPAAALLAQDPGLDVVVGKMIVAATGIDKVRATQFAGLLAAIDATRSAALLREREKMPELRSGARILLAAVSPFLPPGEQGFRQLPGFAADTIAEQEDQLDIQSEVDTLTAVMMAKSVTPPLAIGLFGEWGTGKSFFMARMKKTIQGLIGAAANTPESPFCAHAVQIHFNAWHYADTNLWASLVSSIFDSLDVHLRAKDAAADPRDALLQQLTAAQAAAQAARAEEEQASERLRQEQARLAAAAVEREKQLGSLSSLQAKDIADMLGRDKELKEKAEKALTQLGLPAVIAGAGDLRRALAEAGSLSRRAFAMVTALSHDRAGRLWFGFFLIAMASSPVLVYLIYRFLAEGSVSAAVISTVSVQIAAFAASAAALLRRGTALFAGVMAPLEAAKREADRKLADKRAELAKEEERLQRQVDELARQEGVARAKLEAALQEAAHAEQRLKALEASRTLAYFVAERCASADYRKHLSLVSVVRQDFERLVERIQHSNQEAANAQKLERIILYIDDLDRCPADKVVDVLQAVHLLLAYPLFVVVVGVDARWLLNSLALHYRELGAVPGEARARDNDDQVVSPQHYLEKIFQIPYALRPMNRQGYGRLVGQLMGNQAPVAPVALAQASSPASPDGSSTAPVRTATPAPAAPQVDSPGKPPAQKEAAPSVPPVAPEAQVPEPAAPERRLSSVVERALVIQPWEVDFAQRLYGLIPSPRSAKRLINVYRLLKAGVDSTQLAQFEGAHDAPGDFQLPLLLLAILIHDTEEANRWFAQLIERPGGSAGATLALALREGRSDAGPAHARLMTLVGPIVDAPCFPQNAGLLAYWVPRVARFSFHAWHGAPRA